MEEAAISRKKGGEGREEVETEGIKQGSVCPKTSDRMMIPTPRHHRAGLSFKRGLGLGQGVGVRWAGGKERQRKFN